MHRCTIEGEIFVAYETKISPSQSACVLGDHTKLCRVRDKVLRGTVPWSMGIASNSSVFGSNQVPKCGTPRYGNMQNFVAYETKFCVTRLVGASIKTTMFLGGASQIGAERSARPAFSANAKSCSGMERHFDGHLSGLGCGDVCDEDSHVGVGGIEVVDGRIGGDDGEICG